MCACTACVFLRGIQHDARVSKLLVYSRLNTQALLLLLHDENSRVDSHFPIQKCQCLLAPMQTRMTTVLWNIAMIELVTPCQCLIVSTPGMWLARGTETHCYLHHCTPHTAAQLIKTLTFNKTPHYHNGKTRSWRKTLGLACTLSYPAFLNSFSTGSGSGSFPDANHTVCLCMCVYTHVCILCGPWQLSPFLSSLHPFANFSVL